MLIACIARAEAGEVALDARPIDGSVVIEAAASLDSDQATAWRVLTDYGRYDQFVPGLHSSRVLTRAGRAVRVEQSGDAYLGPLRNGFDVVFEIEEHPEASVQSRIVAGCDCTLQSNYVLRPSGTKVRLVYSGRLAVGGSIGRGLEEAVVERWIGRHLTALVAEIERQSGSAP
jgi:hypothetical protein